MKNALTLERQNDLLAVVRLEAADEIPAWVTAQPGEFFSITRTRDELSIVCDADQVPGDTLAERNWLALKVAGPLAFDLVGIIASLADVLRRANVPIFVISTYDTDYILVRDTDMATAVAALEQAGHEVRAQ